MPVDVRMFEGLTCKYENFLGNVKKINIFPSHPYQRRWSRIVRIEKNENADTDPSCKLSVWKQQGLITGKLNCSGRGKKIQLNYYKNPPRPAGNFLGCIPGGECNGAVIRGTVKSGFATYNLKCKTL